jgi:hypothetical protein
MKNKSLAPAITNEQTKPTDIIQHTKNSKLFYKNMNINISPLSQR